MYHYFDVIAPSSPVVVNCTVRTLCPALTHESRSGSPTGSSGCSMKPIFHPLPPTEASLSTALDAAVHTIEPVKVTPTN